LEQQATFMTSLQCERSLSCWFAAVGAADPLRMIP